MISLFNYAFVWRALAAIFFSSLVAGIIGSIVVEKKIVGMTGGVAHASFGGIGFGYLIGIEPILGGLFFGMVASAIIATIPKQSKIKPDAVMGVLWSFGMALGIVFISLTPGYAPDLTSYLFGDVLMVSNKALIFMFFFTTIVIVGTLISFPYLEFYLFDEQYAKVRQISVNLLKWIVYLVIPIGVIVLVKVVGIILAIALLTIPILTAKQFSRSFNTTIILSMSICLMLGIAGFFISYCVEIPSGACIIILNVVAYGITLSVKKFIKICMNTFIDKRNLKLSFEAKEFENG